MSSVEHGDGVGKERKTKSPSRFFVPVKVRDEKLPAAVFFDQLPAYRDDLVECWVLING